MRLISRFCVAAALTVATVSAFAQAAVKVEQPWARATVPGQPAGGGYFKLTNSGAAADRLLSVSADVSASVELHSMSMEGDVMRMRQIDGIDVPAGGSVELKPGGLHVMFIGLKAPLKVGATFPVTLKFAKAGDVKATVEVKDAQAGANVHDGHAVHKH